MSRYLGSKQFSVSKESIDIGLILSHFSEYLDICDGNVSNDLLVNADDEPVTNIDVIIEPTPPTIQGFLHFLWRQKGIIIATSTFYRWCVEDEDFKALKEIINNGITSKLLTLSLTGKINPNITMFLLPHYGIKNPKFDNTDDSQEVSDDERVVFQIIQPDTLPLIGIDTKSVVQEDISYEDIS